MSILNSQFDVISHDPHPNAGAGLVTVLPVKDAPSPYGSTAASGTPVPGSIFVGAIVLMNSDGEAVLADADTATFPQLPYVTVDGDQDLDGAFVHRITCIQGGAEYQLDTPNFKAGSYTPGQFLTWGTGTASEAGMFVPATTNDQIYAMVGADGQDTNKGTLHVIIPQGISPQVP